MKVKDLPGDRSLASVKVRIPDKLKPEAFLSGLHIMEVYVYSQWAKGVWVKPDLQSSRIYPICIPLEQVLEWEIVE